VAQLLLSAEVSMGSPPPEIHGSGGGDCCVTRLGDAAWYSKVIWESRQLVAYTSEVVVHPETGCVTTLATDVFVRTIKHLSHRER
jgi:hypothetical protein